MQKLSSNNRKQKKITLPVSEVFFSIQGEALSIGKPASFIRVGGCNLKCEFCDTKYALNQNNCQHYKPKELFRRVRRANWPTNLIVITGGEPLLYKKPLEEFIRLFPPWVQFEIETNGTLFPLSFPRGVIRYNVSPKLSSSENKKELRYKPLVLKDFIKEDAIFKFVVKIDKDFKEMEDIIRRIKIPKNKVWVMPEGKKDKQVKENALKYVNKIRNRGYGLSPRLQIWLWENKKGV